MKLKGALLVCCGLAVLQLDAAGAPPDDRGAPSAATISEKIDTIVQRAVDAQLLRPASGSQPGAPSGLTAPGGTAAAPQNWDCPDRGTFDFGAVSEVRSYADLQAIDASAGTSVETEIDRAKAQIVLGMQSEAILSLRAVPAAKAEPLIHLSRLLERRRKTNLAYFKHLAACDDSANLWLAAAFLANREGAGVPLLNGQLNAIRDLPLTMRTDLVALTIPALAELGEAGLSEKLMAAFSEEDIGSSRRLQFLKAIVGVQTREPGAAETLSGFMLKPELQADAYIALRRSDFAVNPILQEVLADQFSLATRSDPSGRFAALAIELGFEEIEQRSDYSLILRIAALPQVQSSAEHRAIWTDLATHLRGDLESEEPLRQLQAIDALIRQEGFDSHHAQYTELMALASERAVSLGYLALAGALARRSGEPTRVLEQQATAAFVRGDDARLFGLAAENAGNGAVLLKAALRAVQTGDADRLKGLEPKLLLDSGAVIALIEEEAVTGNWIASPAVYAAANALTAPELRARVDRVRAIKAARPAPNGAPPAVTDVEQALARSALALEQLQPEAP